MKIGVNLEYTIPLEFLIGTRASGSDSTQLDCFIDEILYVERTLTANEVKKIYNITKDQFGVY